MNKAVDYLVAFIRENDGINDKARLEKLVAIRFSLTRDRRVFYCNDFAVRFSGSSKRNSSNTVTSLSRLQKYDDRPFIACLMSPTKKHFRLANTTLLKKISHTSQNLRENNIRGSFNWPDIAQNIKGIANEPDNFARLFEIHAAVGFKGNLSRLVEATKRIAPTGVKFVVDAAAQANILAAPQRAKAFVESPDCQTLKRELDSKVKKYRSEILRAAQIENANVRGRFIEYLIAGEDERLRQELVAALKAGNRGISEIKTENKLGDFPRMFSAFDTETDIKTKIMILASNPKAYNLDKMLQFLARERSVFMFYFVGVDPGKNVKTVLVSIFQRRLLEATKLLKHWSGRNSRGVTQFEGQAINRLIESPEYGIDEGQAVKLLDQIIAL